MLASVFAWIEGISAKRRLFVSRAPVDPIRRTGCTPHGAQQPAQRKSIRFSKIPEASPSRSFFLIVVSFIAGIAVAMLTLDAMMDESVLWLGLALLIAAAFFVSRNQRLVCLVAIFFLLGVLRVNQSFPPPAMPTVRAFIDQEIVFKGFVVEEGVERSGLQSVTLGTIEAQNEPVFGKLLVRLHAYPEVSFGDELVFRCKPKVPESFDGFRYDLLLESRGIYAICYWPEEVDVRSSRLWSLRGALLEVRSWMLARLALALPEPHASFVGGILFGGSDAFSSDVREDFSRTGLSHITAASGYNIAIFSQMLLISLMRSPLCRRRGLIATALIIVGYVFIAGATASIIRAAIMAGIAMLGTWLGRAQSMRNVLALTAALMLAVHPPILFDVGFQLSFLATIGIVTLSERVETRLAFLPQTLGLRQSASASAAAILLTTPAILWHFGTLSLIAPIANLLILPFVPYLMAFGAAALFAAIFLPPLALVISLPAWALSLLLLSIVNALGALPFASVGLPFAPIIAVISGIVCYVIARSERLASDEAISSKGLLRPSMKLGPRNDEYV